MPKGITPDKPRPIHLVGRSSIISTLLEILDLTQSTDPRSWETAAIRLDEAADMARKVETDLERKAVEEAQAAGFKAPAADLLEVLDTLNPGAHHVLIVGSPVDAGFLGALQVHGRRG